MLSFELKIYRRCLCIALAIFLLSACGVGTTVTPNSDENDTLKEQRWKSLSPGDH